MFQLKNLMFLMIFYCVYGFVRSSDHCILLLFIFYTMFKSAVSASTVNTICCLNYLKFHPSIDFLKSKHSNLTILQFLKTEIKK